MRKTFALLLAVLILFAATVIGEGTKDTLVVGKANEAITLVAFTLKNAPQNKDQIVTFSMFDTMLWRDSSTGEIFPNLATDWEISPDGTVYTFHLRDDVYFWNGVQLTADDVVFTLNQAVQNSTMKTVYFNFYESSRAVDDFTVEIKLTAPCAYFLNVFAGQGGMILSEDYFNEVGGFEAYNEKPMGSGPYKYVSNVSGTSLTLEANEDYWGGAPAIKNVVFKYISDVNAQIIALETHEIDLLMDAPAINLQRMDKRKGIDWSYTQSYQITTASFDTRAGAKMLDENLRKAILSAIDFDAVNIAAIAGLGKRLPINVPEGYTARPVDGTYAEPLGYDEEAAKAFLAASDYDGSPITYGCIAGGKEEAAGKAIQGFLQEVGIDLQLRATDQGTFFANYMASNYDIMVYSGQGATFDTDYLFTGFDQSNMTPDMRSALPDIDVIQELGQDAPSLLDENERIERYTKIADLVNQHAYNMVIFNDVITLAYDVNLKGTTPKSQGNYKLTDFSW